MVEILYKIANWLSGGELSSLENSKKELEQSKSDLSDKVKQLETSATELKNNIILLENTTKEKDNTIYNLENQIQSLNTEKTELIKKYDSKILLLQQQKIQNEDESNKILSFYSKDISNKQDIIDKLEKNGELIRFFKDLKPYQLRVLKEFVPKRKSDVPSSDKLHSSINIKHHHMPKGFENFLERLQNNDYIDHITRTGNMYHDKHFKVTPKHNGEIELNYVNNGLTTFLLIRTIGADIFETTYIAALLKNELK